MFYTIYKTTNLINGKIYIGKHKTKDPNDGYMGSGKLLGFALDKHGKENFVKEILFIFDNEEEMNAKEKELITEDFVEENTNYNLCPGGQGGWGYLNSKEGLQLEKRASSIRNWNQNARKIRNEKIKTSDEYRKKFSETMSKIRKKSISEGITSFPSFSGRKHSKETKQKQSTAMKKYVGEKTSQFGTMWITNGVESKKIKKEDYIPTGWYKGRKMPKKD